MEEAKFCSQCGAKLNSGVKFCSNCGHDLKNSSTEITSDKTIKVEVTNATIEKGFATIEKGVETVGRGVNWFQRNGVRLFWYLVLGIVVWIFLVYWPVSNKFFRGLV